MSHQEAAIRRLEETKGLQLLNLCAGSGKTLTTLAYIQKHGRNDVLVIAPSSILDVWHDEYLKWYGKESTIIRGTPAKRAKIHESLSGVCIIGYETLLRDWKEVFKKKWEVMVIDEVHRAKNPTAKISKLIRKMGQAIPERILLSGTPVKNHWGDLWNPLETIRTGSMLGNWYVFRNRFAIMPIPNIPMIVGWRDEETIKKMIEPLVFSVDPAIIRKDLPKMTMVDVPVELSPVERKAYDSMRDEMVAELENGEKIDAVNAMVKVGRLRELACGDFFFGGEHSSKAKVLLELLETLGEDKCIVFTEYARTADYLHKLIPESAVIQGSTPTADRGDIINKWKESGKVLIGTSSLATGLNLQEAHYIVQFDPVWTKADEDQRVSRSHRTGQSEPVTVYNLMATNSIDQHIRQIIDRKGSYMAELSAWTKGKDLPL